MKKLLLLALLMIAALPIVYAQSFCGNPYADLATAHTLLAPSNVTPTTTAGSATATASTPSTIGTPTVAFGSPNCQSFVGRKIRWENLINISGPSDEIIVNTPLDTLAVVNENLFDDSIAEIRWYTQEGFVPTGLPAPELRVDHPQTLLNFRHIAVSDGANIGDMMLAAVDDNADLHVGRYRATNVSPTFCQTSFADSLSFINFLDYNNGRLAILTSDASDLVVYTINTSSCAFINRVAVDDGGFENPTGIRLDSAGAAYISFRKAPPSPRYHVLKLTGSTINWDRILASVDISGSSPDNLVALVGSNVYAGANLVGGSQISRLSQATGSADYQLNLAPVSVHINGVIKAVNLRTGLYYYGRHTGTSMGAFGSIKEVAGIPSHDCAARYPDFASGQVHTVAEGDFFRIFLGGERAGFGGVQDSVGLMVRTDCIMETVPFNGLLMGTTVDTAANLSTDFFKDSVERPSPGFFDTFTAIANLKSLVVQFQFPDPCGDGEFDAGEECQDVGTCPSGQVCTHCQCNPVCGDGIAVNPPEECDDGNLMEGDGCSNQCLVEC